MATVKPLLRFAAGLLLAILFAGSVVVALAFTYAIVSNAIESGGEWERFEGSLRHYTDTWEVTGDGSFAIRRASWPVMQMLAFCVGAWLVAVAIAYAISRLSASSFGRRPVA